MASAKAGLRPGPCVGRHPVVCRADMSNDRGSALVVGECSQTPRARCGRRVADAGPRRTGRGPLIEMVDSVFQEQFSVAYLQAICAIAGYVVYSPIPDVDKVDWTVCAPGVQGTLRSPRLDIQLKSQRREALGSSSDVRYELDRPTHDALAARNHHVPRILVLVLLPRDEDEWMHQTEAQLSLRRCAYWRCLAGEPSTPNATSVTVSIPRAQVLSVAALKAIMHRIADGEPI